MNSLTSQGYEISKKTLSTEKYKSIKNDLTVTPFTFMQPKNKPKISYTLYTEKDDQLVVPRYYGIQKINKDFDNKLKLTNNNIIFKGELRDYQINIVNLCVSHIKKYGGGLLSMGCGRGKTVLSLKIASLLGVKTLVLVHKEFLQDQWVERIKSFTDASVGIIRSKIVDVENKQIVVGMISSISKRDYGNIFDNFSFVIYDEAHHLPAKVFSRALQKTGSYYTLALSATPNRVDGLFKILHWYVGDMIYKDPSISNKAVSVKMITFNSDELKESKIMVNCELRDHYTKMITDLCHIKSRIKLISKIINILVKQNRKILVLSGRIEHLQEIKKRVDKYITKNNLTYKMYYYIGDLNKKERLEAEQYGDVLFSTYDMAHEALDIPRLNTAILATPKKDVIQSVGRIQRTTLKCGDLRPLIIDIRDNLTIFNNHGNKREVFYKKSQYTIDKSNCVDGKFEGKLKKMLKLDNITEDMINKEKTEDIPDSPKNLVYNMFSKNLKK
jgi:superfamily II DNA or RNA helicase